jgi:uncharacterized protein (DUF736 family)
VRGFWEPPFALHNGVADVSSPALARLPREARNIDFAVLRFAAGLRLRARPPLGLLIAIEAAIGAARKQTGETTMATIGTFTKSEDGSLSGAIKTLTLNVKAAQFRPAEKENDKAPDYRIFSGSTEFGAAWKKTSRENNDYLSVKLDDGRLELRAVTGPDYGRIFDHELVAAVQRIAGDGVGDTRWKVPGVLDWSSMTYNPRVDVTKETTTLYAGDRDVFLFLVDDLNPIEAGRLADGSPDLYFRGFYCWNSEVGSKTLGLASFYLRAVCQNRNLWGVEDFQELTLRHSKYVASRFAHEAAPALLAFANTSPAPFVAGIKAARERIVARDDDDRRTFLKGRGFSKAETTKIIDTVLAEEGRPPESVFDFVQGITAVARAKTHQDARLDLETRARRLLEAV